MFKSLLLLGLFSLALFCDPAVYDDQNMYIEIAQSDTFQHKFIIRAETQNNSFLVFSHYKFKHIKNNLYISFFMTTPKWNKEMIKYKNWGGIEFDFQDSLIDFEKTSFYYKDKKGLHKIIKGTNTTWKNRIVKEWDSKKENSTIPDSVYKKALSDL